MEITVKGKNIQITDAIREYAFKRLGKLDKYFDSEAQATVTCSVEKDRHTVEVTVLVGGLVLRGEEESHDLYASIDLVVDIIEKQINKYKTRIGRRLRAESLRNGNGYVERVADEDLQPKIVRSKKFAFKPMSVEEAILQMNLVGHDFFVFSNADSDEVNVVYKRKDGNYGLIEPRV